MIEHHTNSKRLSPIEFLWISDDSRWNIMRDTRNNDVYAQNVFDNRCAWYKIENDTIVKGRGKGTIPKFIQEKVKEVLTTK